MSISSTDDLAKLRILPKPRLFPVWMSPIIGLFGAFAFFYFVLVLSPSGLGGIKRAQNSYWLQASRTITIGMFEYANDHDANYPTGNSSTEVFQKLLNGGYVNDPAIFFIPLYGKVKPVPGQRLKPENVGWDVTTDLSPNDPGELPIVFITGYKVTYVPGGAAVPIVKSHPEFVPGPRTWSQWWHGEQPQPPVKPTGIAVTYKSNSAMFKAFPAGENSDGSIPNFIPPDFTAPPGKTYRQLTPDGPLQ